MVVCKFFLQGNCRFGDNCKFEHPGRGGSAFGSGGGANNSNRFTALSSTGNRSGSDINQKRQWSIEGPQLSQVRTELSKERPKWVLSSYSVVKDTPASLFETNEYSAEEIRLRFYELASKGQEAQADQEATQLWAKAEQDVSHVLNNVDEIPKFMEEAEKKHPNRYDFLKFDGTKSKDVFVQEIQSSQSTASTAAFGTGAGTFGQPSNSANPFSKPAAATFGQQTGPSPFGGAATFGRPAESSTFGQTGFGTTATSTNTAAFGQPSAAGAFGKPAFGNTAFGQSAFGQAAQPTSTTAPVAPAFGSSGFGSTSSAFGKPSTAFGQPSQPTSAFGQPAQTTAFGQSSQSAFGQTGFGQGASPFGQPAQASSAFGQAAQPASGFGQSAFGQPAKPVSGFGQTGFGQSSQPTSNSPFGQTSALSGFGANTAATSAFGQPAQNVQSPFGSGNQTMATTTAPEVSMDAPLALQPAVAQTTLFGQPSANQTPQNIQASATTSMGLPPRPNVNSSSTPHPLSNKPHHPIHYTESLPEGPTQIDPSTKRVTLYRGQRVAYLSSSSSSASAQSSQQPPQSQQATPPIPCYNRPDGKGPEKIWFPESGATLEVAYLNKPEKIPDLQDAPTAYTDVVKDAYKTLFETGKFEIGKIPIIAPMREWIAYDF